MRKLFFCGILICLAMRFNAQLKPDQPLKTNQTPSALISALQKNNPDTTRLQLLLQLSLYYYFQRDDGRENLDTVLILLQQSEKLSNEIHSLKWQPEILCFLGKYYYKAGNISEADKYFMKATEHIKHMGSIDKQIERWNALAFNIEELDTTGLTRINCFEIMRSLYHQLNNKEKEIEADKDIADTHMKQGKLDLAGNELLSVLAKYKAIGFQNLHYTYNLLSVNNHLKGDYHKALYYALQTIESMPETTDTWTIIFYTHVANLYDELGQTGKSIEYYRLIFKLTPPNPVDFYYIREGGIFVRDLIKENKAKEAHNFLFDFAKKYPPVDPYGKASLARTFAFYYNFVGNYFLADKYTREMISLEPLLGKNNEVRRDVEYDIGEYYLRKKQFEEAGTYFERALDEAVLNNSANAIKEVNLRLFKTDSSRENYISAIRHLNQFRQLNDSIFNEARSKQIEEVLAKYEAEKKEQNIKLLERESKLQQNELLQASHTRNWILGGMALLLIIAGLMYRNIRLKQRTNKKLEIHEKEIEKQNDALRHLVVEKDSLLKEKEWLIKEIHHRVKNNLQIVISLLNAQSEFLHTPSALNAIRDSRERMQAIAIIHQKLYQVDNSTVVNMRVYINELVDNIKDSFADDKRIRLTLDIDNVDLDISQSVPLGLIMNEAITNAVKYAFPQNERGLIQISLNRLDMDRLQLKIADNGKGLPAEVDIKHSNSLGIKLIRLFSEQLEGDLYFVNNNGLEINLKFKAANYQDAGINKSIA